MGTSWNIWNFNWNFMKLVYGSQWELHGIYGTSMGTSWNWYESQWEIHGIYGTSMGSSWNWYMKVNGNFMELMELQ